MLALKEWAAVVHALLDGRQTVLLRKGGIHEKRFSLRGSRFVVFPTVAHSHAESTRPESHRMPASGPGTSWWTARASAGVSPGFTKEEILAADPLDPAREGGLFERLGDVLAQLSQTLTAS